MPRRSIPGTAERNIRVHLESYNWIKDFFAASPAGITTTDACREILYRFGLYCKEQMDKGSEASWKDIAAIDGIILGYAKKDKVETPDD
jgi:hypothetical protein